MLIVDARRHPRAFTLVELVVTIVILGILASIGSISYLKVIDNSKDASAVALVQQLHREATALAVLEQRTTISEADFSLAAADASASGAETSAAGPAAGTGVLAASKRVRLTKDLVGDTWTAPPPYSPDSTSLHLTVSPEGVVTSALRSDTGNCVLGRQRSIGEAATVWVVEQDLGTNCSSRFAVNGPESATVAPGGQIIDTTQPLPGSVSAVTVADTGTGAKVSFTAPAYLGTSPVTSYKVVATDGTTTLEATTNSPSATLADVPNSGSPWTFTVTARNASGEGPGALAGFGAPTVDGIVSPTFVQTGTDYACPTGGTLIEGNCVTPAVTYPAVGTVNYSCPDGQTLSGSSCVVPAKTSPAQGTTAYSCPEGGTLSGTTCTVPSSTYTASGTTSYSCNTGDSLSGATCTKPAYTYAATASSYYYCNSGTLSGSTCTVAGYSYAATGDTSYSCPNGGTRSGTTCTKPSSTYTATFVSATWSCPTGTWRYGSTCVKNGTVSRRPPCVVGQTAFGTTDCYPNSALTAATSTPSYWSCPSGGTLSGSTCTVAASSYPATSTTSYSCPSGGSLSGTWCSVSGYTTSASTGTSYSCPNGGSRSGSTCTVAATTYTAASSTSYSCPTGGSLSGTTCTLPASTYEAAGATTYSCPAGGNLSGQTCTIPSTTTAAASSTSYACTDGDTLTGSQCATRQDSYEATGSPVGHNTFAVTDVVAQRARLVTANGTPVTIGQPTQLGRCPGEVTLRATGLGGQADKFLGAYCS